MKGDDIKVSNLGASKYHWQKLMSQEGELAVRSRRTNLVDYKLMIGRGEICNRHLETRLSACHIVRPSEDVRCHCHQEEREWFGTEIIGTGEKDEAMRIVFRLNIAKHRLKFEPGKRRDMDKLCRGLLGGQWEPRKDDSVSWLQMSFEKMVSVW